jgi:hypothetical protein
MMSAPEPSVVTGRAEALATLALTRRNDLEVTGERFRRSSFLLVTILREGKVTGRQFGVELSARFDGTRRPRVDRAALRRERERYREMPLPLCAFLFDIWNDDGYFRWIVEPKTDETAARLEVGSRLGFQPLTDAALDEIVEQVNAWYDRRGVAGL